MTNSSSPGTSDRETWMDLIRNEYDPRPNLGKADYPGFEWDDGAGRIADAILADQTLLLRKHAEEIERLRAGLAQPSRPSLVTVVAQLRHAYAQLTAGTVRDQMQFADGLIAPAIRWLENLESAPESAASQNIAERDLSVMADSPGAGTDAGIAQAPKPAAWGRVIDGEAVTVSRIRTGANDEPLYAAPPAQAPSDPYAKDIADWCQRSLDDARKHGRLETRPFVQNVELIIKALRAYSVPSTERALIGGTESCTCHFLGAGTHHIPGCPYYTVVTSKDQP